MLTLLDHPRMVTQFCGLERRVARGGRDSIDHGPNGHDDVCNAVTGAVLRAAQLFKGTTELWMPQLGTRAEQASQPEQRQLVQGLGSQMFAQPETRTCASCRHFDENLARCLTREMGTAATLLACEVYAGRLPTHDHPA